MPWRRQIAAIAGTGSTAVDDVVPMDATTHAGRRPAARSRSISRSSAAASIANAESVGIRRRRSSP